jgi:hypothetical protein
MRVKKRALRECFGWSILELCTGYRSKAQPMPINKSQDQPAMADARATK